MKKTLSFILAAVMMMTAIVVVSVNADYQSGDWGYTIKNGEATINRYYGSATTVTIPSTIGGYPVTALSYWYDSGYSRGIFYGKSTTSVTIPDSVTTIGGYTFRGCTSLTSVTIPDSVKKIGDWAFSGCTSLTSVTIPDGVKTIGNHAFSNTGYYNDNSNWEDDVLYIGHHLIKAKDSISGAYSIKPETLTIADWAFYKCISLTSVTIPDSVTTIGGYAFSNCTSLKSVTIPDSVTSIGYEAFDYCSSPIKVFYGGTSSQWSAISIASYNSNLTNAKRYYNCTEKNDDFYYSVNDDGNVTIIAYTGSAAEITIPASVDGHPVTSIGGYAFYYCTSLTSVTIPDSVTEIGSDAFSGCTSLTSVSCPERFVGLFGNNKIVGIILDKDKTEINRADFLATYPNILDVHAPEDSASFSSYDGVLYNKAGTRLLICSPKKKEITIPKTLKLVDVNACANCNSLETVYFGGSKEEWDEIRVRLNSDYTNDALLAADVIFNGVLPNSPGDLNGDRTINSRDVIALLRLIVGFTDGDTLPQAADYDGNGRVNARDVIALMKLVLGPQG